jgi:hypothetical protein
VAYTTRVARLTHLQYDNTVRDLLGLEARATSEFLVDALFAGYDNNVDGLRVEGRLGRDYRRAAEDLAAQAVANSSSFSQLVPCSPATSGCAEDFIRSFGLKTYRRPLRDEELAALRDLFERGPELVASGDAFRDGVQVVVEAMLQSPKFLYRAELSTGADDRGAIALDDFEIATRLSYMLWNTTPDDELLAAASAGELHTDAQIRQAAERLLESPRAEPVVLDFHRQWLDLAHYAQVAKNEALYPGFGPHLTPALTTETLEFVRHVTFDEQRGLQTLLTAPYTYANHELAPYYGAEVPVGAGFQRIDLDPSERAGFLTQLGFLASHAYSDNTSPIHRGVFVLTRILCIKIPPPPGDVDFTLPQGAELLPTTREKIELQTSPAACNNCHSLINPVGFAFESYDAVGRSRTEENGVPVDTAGSLALSGGALEYSGATDLIAAMATSPEARECYARNWLRYAYGRVDRKLDDGLIGSLSEQLASDAFTARDLLLALTQGRAFTHRLANPEDAP